MLSLLSGKQMKEADGYSIRTFGMPELVLMERAALAVRDHICSEYTVSSVFVLCGTGNNGGDGLAVARLFLLQGIPVSVLVVGDPAKATDSWQAQYQLLSKLDQEVCFCLPGQRPESWMFPDAAVYVDALFGVGLSRPLSGSYAEAVQLWNQRAEACRAIRYAVDIPSGVDADTGAVLGCSIQAQETITFGFGKIGLYRYPGAGVSGRVTIADIGFAPDAEKHITGKPVYALQRKDVTALCPRRSPEGNKGTFGKVLILAGAEGMAGAAYLSGLASLRSGAGLVVIGTHPANRVVLQQLLPEAIVSCWPVMEQKEDVPQTEDMIQTEAYEAELQKWLTERLFGVKAVVVGPGLSQGTEARLLLQQILRQRGSLPLIIDADGLNLLARMETRTLGENVVLTPHPGELARLLGQTISQVKENLLQNAGSLQKRYGCVAVCKDARTVVAGENGALYLNLTGNSGMATAGAGDALTGVIAALAAQGCLPLQAAVLGVWIHGAAGDLAAKQYGRAGMKTGDLCSCLGLVWKDLEEEMEK